MRRRIEIEVTERESLNLEEGTRKEQSAHVSGWTKKEGAIKTHLSVSAFTLLNYFFRYLLVLDEMNDISVSPASD